MLRRKYYYWISASLLVGAAVLCLACWYSWPHRPLHDRFEAVRAGMSNEQVHRLLGPPGDYLSDWRLQLRPSGHAEVWQMKDGEFVRHDYRGIDVHTKIGLLSKRISVWKTDQSVIIVEFDGNGLVCGKHWYTE